MVCCMMSMTNLTLLTSRMTHQVFCLISKVSTASLLVNTQLSVDIPMTLPQSQSLCSPAVFINSDSNTIV